MRARQPRDVGLFAVGLSENSDALLPSNGRMKTYGPRLLADAVCQIGALVARRRCSESDVTTPTTPSETKAAAYPSWVRVVLVIVGVVETLAALADLPGIFYDYEHNTALLKFAQALTSLRIAISPLIAAAALYFAIVGRVSHSIIALAALILLLSLTELPSFAIHGLELSREFTSIVLALQRFVYPVLAVAAIVLAVKDRLLGLATLFAILPGLTAAVGVLAFALGVTIYGF